jgi:hypothetical protein
VPPNEVVDRAAVNAWVAPLETTIVFRVALPSDHRVTPTSRSNSVAILRTARPEAD